MATPWELVSPDLKRKLVSSKASAIKSSYEELNTITTTMLGLCEDI